MTLSNKERLCGGTFFVLLLQARKRRSKARDKFKSGTDRLLETDVLKRLVCIAYPQFQEPAGKTFNQNTSGYKACTLSSSAYLPFSDSTVFRSFDKQIKTKYSEALCAMTEFIKSFIDAVNENKRLWLVKALLEVIEKDDSIPDSDVFYICDDGHFHSKTEMGSLTEICFQSFLLGIWHYIVMNRPENTIGRDTYERWHEPPKLKGQQHKFTSRIGDGIIRSLNIRLLELSESDEVQDDATTEEKQETLQDEPEKDASTEETAGNTANQIINNPIIINQNGNNNIIIGNIEKLTINNS